MECVFVEAFEVAIGSLKNHVSDASANECGEGFHDTFFGADQYLIDDVALIGFILRFGMKRELGNNNGACFQNVLFLRGDSTKQ